MPARLPVEAQPTVVQGNKKGFCKCISSRRKTWKNVDLLLNGSGGLLTKDMEKADVFNAFFASFFTDKTGLQCPRALRATGRFGARSSHPW